MKIATIILARLGSTRSPEKMLADIDGKPLLRRIIDNMKHAQKPDDIILATTCKPNDERLAVLARNNNCLVYRGSVDDVIERMLGACQTYDADFCIIAEADELFIDPKYVDRIINLAIKTGADFVKTRKFPIGSWIVGVSRAAMEKVYINKGNASTDGWARFFTEDPNFHTEWLEPGSELPAFEPNLRLTIDYEEDLTLAREIYKRLRSSGKDIRLKEVLELVNECPDIMETNSHLNDPYWARIRSRIGSDKLD